MKEAEIKYMALRAERSAIKLDVCLAALHREIQAMKKDSEENDGENIYTALFLDGIHSLINEEIAELFQIKHDLLQKIEKKDRS